MSDNAYVSQIVTEILGTTPSKAKISQAVVEVFYKPVTLPRVSQVVVEVLQSTSSVSSNDVSVTSNANVSHTIGLGLVKSVNVTNTFTASQMIVVTTDFHYTSNPDGVTLDGFDHYTDFSQPFKFFDQTQSLDWVITVGTGRFGGSALTFRHGGFVGTVLKDDSFRGWYGFAMKMGVVPTEQQYLWRLATTTLDDWYTVGFLGGHLNVTRHGLPLYNGPSVDLSVWNYFEIDGNNLFNIWINGLPAEWIGVNYPSPTPTQATQLMFTGTPKWIGLCVNGTINDGSYTYFDDFYYSVRQRLGPGYIDTLFAYTDGQYTDWLRSGSRTTVGNWDSLSDRPNVDYNVSVLYPNELEGKNSSLLRGLSVNEDIIVVTQLDVIANNNQDSGGLLGEFKAYYYAPSDTVGSEVGHSGIIIPTGSNIENFSHYLYQIPVRPVSPGPAWTPTTLASPEFGFKALSSSALAISQMVLEVYRLPSGVLPVGPGNINNVFVSNSLSVAQTISINKVVTLLVTSIGVVTQNPFVNSPRVLSVSSQAYVTQTVYGINATIYISIVSTASVRQTVVGRQGLYRVNVVSTANADSHFLRRDVTIFVTVVSTANIKQRVNSEYRLRVTSTANIDQNYYHLRITTHNLSHTGTIQNVFAPSRETTLHINDLLTVLNTYVHSGTYERDFQDIQILTDTFRSAILVSDTGYVYDPYPVGPGQPPRIIPPHPVVTGTPVISARETIIDSPGGTVILPAAEFGDNFAAKVQNNVRKTMTGKIYTYIRTQPTDRFTLSWILGLQKALELASVIKNNNDNHLQPFDFYTLTLWNGQIWRAKVISTDIPITHEGRWQNSDNNNSEIEKMTVSIQFEGIQLL